MARKNWKPGNFFAVPLSEDDFGFGRVIRFPIVAIYDARHPAVLSPEELSGMPVLWKLLVYRYTLSAARWPVIGHRELEPDLAEQVLFFKQDFFTQKTEIYHEDGTETPASIEECLGLERAAVWDAEPVEQRIRDHFAGIPNQSVIALRLKLDS